MFNDMFEKLEKNPPLIHNITNYVTVNDCANVVLAAGGAPLMADDIEEVEEIVSISSALYINVGTLNQRTVESMIISGKKANELNIPVILDPVGMGASKLRIDTVNRLIDEIKISVIKGNMSEIKSIYKNCHNSGGVDVKEEDIISVNNIEENVLFAKKVANKLNCIIAITGPIDIVSDGNKQYSIHNGHEMMSKVTGTGCMTGSVIGTYCGANKKSLLDATILAIATMGLAGELAYKKVESNNEGTASFKRYLIDNISLMNGKILKEGAKIENR